MTTTVESQASSATAGEKGLKGPVAERVFEHLLYETLPFDRRDPDVLSLEDLVDEAHHPFRLPLRFQQQVGVDRIEFRPLLGEHELERALDSGKGTAEVVDDLGGEVGLGLFGFALGGDVFERQRHAGSHLRLPRRSPLL